MATTLPLVQSGLRQDRNAQPQQPAASKREDLNIHVPAPPIEKAQTPTKDARRTSKSPPNRRSRKSRLAETEHGMQLQGNLAQSPTEQPQGKGIRSKIVLFLPNSDRHLNLRPKYMRITSNRFFSLNDLLGDLTAQFTREGYHFPYGVRQLYSPVNGRRIVELNDLEEGGLYLCAGYEPFKPLGVRERNKAGVERASNLPPEAQAQMQAGHLPPLATSPNDKDRKSRHPSRNKMLSHSLQLPQIGQTGNGSNPPTNRVNPRMYGLGMSVDQAQAGGPNSPYALSQEEDMYPYYYYYQQYMANDKYPPGGPADSLRYFKFPAMRSPLNDTRFHRMYRRFKLPPLQVGGHALLKSPDSSAQANFENMGSEVQGNFPIYQFKPRGPVPEGMGYPFYRGIRALPPMPIMNPLDDNESADEETGSPKPAHSSQRRLLTIIYYHKNSEDPNKSPVKLIKILLSNKPEKQNHYSLKQVHKILNKSFRKERDKGRQTGGGQSRGGAEPNQANFHLVTPGGREITSTPDLERVISGAEGGEPELDSVALSSAHTVLEHSVSERNFLFIAVTQEPASGTPLPLSPGTPPEARVNPSPRLTRADIEQIHRELIAKNANTRLVQKLQNLLARGSNSTAISSLREAPASERALGAKELERQVVAQKKEGENVFDSGIEENDTNGEEAGHPQVRKPPIPVPVVAPPTEGVKLVAALPPLHPAKKAEPSTQSDSDREELVVSKVEEKRGGDSEADKTLKMLEKRRQQRMLQGQKRHLPPPTLPLTTIQESPIPHTIHMPALAANAAAVTTNAGPVGASPTGWRVPPATQLHEGLPTQGKRTHPLDKQQAHSDEEAESGAVGASSTRNSSGTGSGIGISVAETVSSSSGESPEKKSRRSKKRASLSEDTSQKSEPAGSIQSSPEKGHEPRAGRSKEKERERQKSEPATPRSNKAQINAIMAPGKKVDEHSGQEMPSSRYDDKRSEGRESDTRKEALVVQQAMHDTNSVKLPESRPRSHHSESHKIPTPPTPPPPLPQPASISVDTRPHSGPGPAQASAAIPPSQAQHVAAAPLSQPAGTPPPAVKPSPAAPLPPVQPAVAQPPPATTTEAPTAPQPPPSRPTATEVVPPPGAKRYTHTKYITGIDRLSDRYDIGRQLGDGNFAVVKECRSKASGNKYAIKVIDKSKLKNKEYMLENEIEILRLCNHANIVKLREQFESEKEVYLIMELAQGGDLFDAITANTKFPEWRACEYVTDLTNSLFYLHSRGIVHRDLKPENLLICHNKDGAQILKLADFGLAMEVKKPIFTVCGTPTYVAPEILEEKGYGLEVDLWALGVVSYILLCGFPPFRSPQRRQSELFRLIRKGDFEFISPYWDHVSHVAKDLIRHLLVVDAGKRFKAIDVLCHPWVLTRGNSKRLDRATLSEAQVARRRELEALGSRIAQEYRQVKERDRERALEKQRARFSLQMSSVNGQSNGAVALREDLDDGLNEGATPEPRPHSQTTTSPSRRASGSRY